MEIRVATSARWGDGISFLPVVVPKGAPMDPTRNRNLIWLAFTCAGGPRSGETNLAAAWDVAVGQMVAAQRTGDLADAERWEAEANTLYVRITGRQPDE